MMKTLKFHLSAMLLIVGAGFASSASATHVGIVISEPNGQGGLPVISDMGSTSLLNLVQISSMSAERATIQGEVAAGSLASPSVGKTAFVLTEGAAISDLVLLDVSDSNPNTTNGYFAFIINFFSAPTVPAIPPDFTNILSIAETPPNVIGPNDAGSCTGLTGYFDLSAHRCSDGFHIFVSSEIANPGSDIPEPMTPGLVGIALGGMYLAKRRQPRSL